MRARRRFGAAVAASLVCNCVLYETELNRLSEAALAQVESRSATANEAQEASATSTAVGPMVRVRGGTIQMGIDATQIPSLEKTFDIEVPQLFQDEVPKHSVTLDDFVKPPKAATLTGATFSQLFTSGYSGTNATPFQTRIDR